MIFGGALGGPEFKIARAESALNAAKFAVTIVGEDDGCEENGDCIVEALCAWDVGVCTATPLNCVTFGGGGMMRGWMLGFPLDA